MKGIIGAKHTSGLHVKLEKVIKKIMVNLHSTNDKLLKK